MYVIQTEQKKNDAWNPKGRRNRTLLGCVRALWCTMFFQPQYVESIFKPSAYNIFLQPERRIIL